MWMNRGALPERGYVVAVLVRAPFQPLCEHVQQLEISVSARRLVSEAGDYRKIRAV